MQRISPRVTNPTFLFPLMDCSCSQNGCTVACRVHASGTSSKHCALNFDPRVHTSITVHIQSIYQCIDYTQESEEMKYLCSCHLSMSCHQSALSLRFTGCDVSPSCAGDCGLEQPQRHECIQQNGTGSSGTSWYSERVKPRGAK